ncbi:MAG: hypothetical protein M3273_06965 [Actinomycetota bacterium]|nr:hypothetical protein [Actinomycetota bacterium]
MSDDEVRRLRAQAREDRKLIQDAAQVLGEIDRGPGLTAEHADVLAALRIRLEGKPRASLEDLLSAAGDISAKKDLKDVLATPDDEPQSDWPVIEEKKRDWPGI